MVYEVKGEERKTKHATEDETFKLQFEKDFVKNMQKNRIGIACPLDLSEDNINSDSPTKT